jgi:HSP90 family molecular chaperone
MSRAFFSTDSTDATEASFKEKEPVKAAPPAEPVNAKSHQFKAETRQLLDIVTNSIYTDKEVFLRELVSNASDALEKVRHLQSTNSPLLVNTSDSPLEIALTVDEDAKTITITDSGVGMTAEELEANLGTIAKSGSREFMADATEQMSDIIGKFGVGFYSSFMIGATVSVTSKSAKLATTDTAAVWTSDGGGDFSIAEAPNTDESFTRGSIITIHLKDSEAAEYGKKSKIEAILKKYSNFVNFPITLNGERVNTMDAVWSLEPKNVDLDMHKAFYKFLTGGFDDPLYHLHYRADAPLEIKTLLYVPSHHGEKYGMGRMNPGVSLYSRKVLIEKDSPDILPDWLRFVKGVVDSEDLPLSISREKSQDSKLIVKLKTALTRRFINELSKKAKKDPETYKTKFWPEYGHFLKEGVCQDYQFQSQLAKLLYFESSKGKEGELCTLEEYVGRMAPDQKDIYFLCAPTRKSAAASPYMEAFESSGKEVIFVYTAIDDFVMSNLGTFEGRQLITAEKGGLDLGDDKKEDADKKDEESDDKNGSFDDDVLCAWMSNVALHDKVDSVKTTSRLVGSPAIITGHESGALRRMMKMVDTQGVGSTGLTDLEKQTLEINPKHAVIRRIEELSKQGGDKEEAAKIAAEAVFNNAVISAGLLDDARTMVPNVQKLLEKFLEKA